MKGNNIIIKIRADVTLLTIIKWRLLGFHKPKHSSIIPDNYEAKDGKLFRIEMEGSDG